MNNLGKLLGRVSVLRIGLFVLLWGSLSYPIIRANLPMLGEPQYAAIDDPPRVTQLAFAPTLLRAVADPEINENAVRIAWVSASPVLYGDLSNPPSTEQPPGFIQTPIAETLSASLGRPVAVEAYTMPNSRLVEKFLTAYQALQTQPDAIIVSLTYWDYSDHWVSMPAHANFRVGLIARNPLALLQDDSLLPFLHAGEIGWAIGAALMPTLTYRMEIGAELRDRYGALDPLTYPVGTSATPGADQARNEAIYTFETTAEPVGDETLEGRIGNEGVLAGLLDMLVQSGIPAIVYIDPTQRLEGPETRGLEAALSRYRSGLPAESTLAIESRALNRFLEGINFRNTNHLAEPAQSMTDYLSFQIETVLGQISG